MMQFWNLFNARYFATDRSLLSDLVGIIAGKRRFTESFSNGFLLIAAVIVLGQVLIVNLAGNNFEVAPLSIQDWIWILAMTSPILLLPDLTRSLRILLRRQPDTNPL